jgi:hypothetical protein
MAILHGLNNSEDKKSWWRIHHSREHPQLAPRQAKKEAQQWWTISLIKNNDVANNEQIKNPGSDYLW